MWGQYSVSEIRFGNSPSYFSPSMHEFVSAANMIPGVGNTCLMMAIGATSLNGVWLGSIGRRNFPPE
jgi:hypothetical protein